MTNYNLDDVCCNDVGCRLTLMFGENPILTGTIKAVSDDGITLGCECVDTDGTTRQMTVVMKKNGF